MQAQDQILPYGLGVATPTPQIIGRYGFTSFDSKTKLIDKPLISLNTRYEKSGLPRYFRPGYIRTS